MHNNQKRIYTSAIIILLISATILIVTQYPIIKGELYSGDHITVNLKVDLNGKEISLQALQATCIYDKNNSRLVESNNGIYKARGGEYGEYSFELIIPQERLNGFENDLLLKLNYMNSNDWYISESDCYVDLTTDNIVVTASSNVVVKYNDNSTRNYDKEVDVINNVINVNWGL